MENTNPSGSESLTVNQAASAFLGLMGDDSGAEQGQPEEVSAQADEYVEESEDNAAEYSSAFLAVFPEASAAGVAAGANIANYYFSGRAGIYAAEYPEFEIPAACDLMCRIDENGGELTYDIWGDWLLEVNSVLPAPNAASRVFTGYAPLRQTFLNQLAAFINGEQSLQAYFDDLWFAYYTGSVNPIPVPPECECAPEYAVPIIAPNWEGLTVPMLGADITDEGDGYWSILSEQGEDNSWYITIAETGLRDFIISDVTLDPVNCAECFLYRQGVTNTVDCVNFCDQFGGEVSRYGWTWNATDGQIKVTFKMELA